MMTFCTDGNALFTGGGLAAVECGGGRTLIENVRFTPWEVRTGVEPVPVILLVLYGRVDVTVNGGERLAADAGSVVMLPADCCYALTAREDAHLLAYAIENLMELWEGDVPSGRGNGVSAGRVASLEMNERLWEYAMAVSGYLFDGMSGQRFMRMKAYEFIYLLQFYYARDQLAGFFSSLLNGDADFTRIVMDNWDKVRSKAELAAIAGLSTSRFGVRFKEVFGMSPYQWMMTRRSEQIYYRLVYGSESLKEISEEFRFGSVQHFNDFCKKRFGMTPGKIRSRKKVEQPVNV